MDGAEPRDLAGDISLLTVPATVGAAATERVATAGRAPVTVAYVESNLDGTIGGSYYSLLYLVKGLDRTQYTPLVVFHSAHTLLERFQEAGIETAIVPPARPLTFAEKFRASWMPLRAAAAAAQKALNFFQLFVWQGLRRAIWLRRRGARVVHLNNSIVKNHDWMLAARIAGIPCMTHERGINDWYSGAARYWAERLEAIVCISEAVRRQLEQHGLDNGNLLTIHNAFDPAEAKVEISPAELRARHGIAPEVPVIVMAGNLKAWKGQETVIRAMATVVEAHHDVRCLLVGAPVDPGFAAKMRELVNELGLQARVLFLGFHDNVIDYMAMSDIVVHASVLPEPFGRVALEAMACRKPIIGSAAGGIPEIIEDGVTGLTFPPGDADRLAAALIWMLDQPGAAAAMGERGYQRLVEHFPISANVRATQQLYERILSDGSRVATA